ncbi:hypothetical protein [Streptosporangium sp. NPDC087985]|uniref:hypothetical protein n=1 Tax=Streptosporangium sp. NPDC087985 TaxID=3366196 RepID=UPI00380AC363
MNNSSAPVLDRATVSGCGCFAAAPPMPMGCAACGHAPYAHGCPGRAADHEYAPPSGALMAIRLEARRTGDLSLHCFEPLVIVAPAEAVPLVPTQHSPEQHSPEQAPAVAPAVPVPSPRRLPCRSRRAYPFQPRPTRQPRLGSGRLPVTRPRRSAGCALHRAATGPLPHRPPGSIGWCGPYDPYAAPHLVPLHLMAPLRPALRSSGRAFNPLQEVRSMEDAPPLTARSTRPQATTSPATKPQSAIPGWRVILSDAGRLWASREQPFSAAAFHAGAERTVDADTVDALRAATDRQESIAQEAHEQAGRVIS